MASYEVQVVQSSPFECVLRDRNQQQQSCRDSNGRLSRASFKKNLKKFIRDHLSVDQNSQNHNNNSSNVADRHSNANRPCLRPLKNNDNENGTEHHHHKLARVSVKFVDPDEEATRPESQTTPAASSLVQMWEARLKKTSSDVSCSETSPSVADGTIWDETLSPDSEPQPEKTGESGEKERVRIVDIIKKLTHGRKEKNGNEQQMQEEVNNGESELSSCRESRLICTVSVTEERGGGGGGSFQLQQIVSSPRLRGRQAFNDLLMQMQRERHLELESLAKRQAVSTFPQRGRIQSLLRLRNLHRCNAIQDQCRNQSRGRFSQKNTRGLKSKASKSQSLEVTCASSNQSSTVSFHVSGTLAACKEEQEKDGDFEEPTRNPESQETERDEESATPRESYESVVEAVTSWAEHEMMMQQDDQADCDHPLNYMANSYDWISEIARPKSYWEDLRKTWHEQALATSQNEDIRHLLERKTVSTFLRSDFRERMDKLMLARLQLEPAENKSIAFLQRQLQQQDAQQRHDEEQEASPYFETPSLSIQLPSPFMRSWSDQGHDDAAEQSDQLCSSSPSEVQSYRHGQRSPSSNNHPSLEMEQICDLKGQIEQLHSEMAELRKSVLKMHQSYSTVETKKNTDSNERSAGKRSCIMCHEMLVDSLLYRCGHMCTCMRCGQELQLNSGKCPVCKASIADVVQAYLDA